MAFILNPAELAQTLRRDLGLDGATKYAEMMGRGSTELGRAYHEAYQLLKECEQCPECGVYPAGMNGGICEGCHAYREHTENY